jgi:hypothetical protein
MKTAAYNAPIIPRMLLLAPKRIVLVWFLLFAAHATGQDSADWVQPLRQLAQKISAIAGPGAVAISFDNRSSMPAADADLAQRELRSELSGLGVQPSEEANAVAAVHVTLSENNASYVWVAALAQSASDSSVAIVTSPKRQLQSGSQPANAVVIRKNLLWIQPEPILDAAWLAHTGAAPTLIVLDPDKVTLYLQQGSRWQLTQTLPIVHSRPWPRDMRGRLVLSQFHLFDVFLPGMACESTAIPPLNISCRAVDDAWPVGFDGISQRAFFNAARNYFNGTLAPGIGRQTNIPPFYSAAPLPRNNYVLWLMTGIDGNVRIADGVSQLTLSALDWGSGIASLKTSCGSGWQVLATGRGDRTDPDAVRAYEIADRTPVAVSATESFPGPITALWTQSDGAAAVAVTRNLKAGTYEAYRLAIACNQ